MAGEYSPTIHGEVPETGGRHLWVAPGAGAYTVGGTSYTAADTNDGLAPGQAFATIDAANNACTANAGDIILCLPGSHDASASIALDTAGVTLMGLPSGLGNFMKQKATIGPVTGNQGINVTAADIEIAYLNIEPVTADTGIDITSGATNFHIHHCSFNMFDPVVNAATIGLEVLSAAANVLISDCYFQSDGAQGPAIQDLGLVNSIIQNCVFNVTAGTWASAITQAAAGIGLIIRDCDFTAPAADYTACITGTGTAAVSMAFIAGCRFASSTADAVKAIELYDDGDVDIVENYQAGGVGSDGGVLTLLGT